MYKKSIASCLAFSTTLSAYSNDQYELPEHHYSDIIPQLEILGEQLEKNWSMPTDPNDPNNLVINGWFNDSRLWKEAWVETRDAVTGPITEIAGCTAALSMAVSSCAVSGPGCAGLVAGAAGICGWTLSNTWDYVNKKIGK